MKWPQRQRPGLGVGGGWAAEGTGHAATKGALLPLPHPHFNLIKSPEPTDR